MSDSVQKHYIKACAKNVLQILTKEIHRNCLTVYCSGTEALKDKVDDAADGGAAQEDWEECSEEEDDDDGEWVNVQHSENEGEVNSYLIESRSGLSGEKQDY